MFELDLKPEHRERFHHYYRHLPEKFLPLDVFKDRDQHAREDAVAREAWREDLCKEFPRQELPRNLRLKPFYTFQPPRFLYGWAMERPVLKTIAEKCGFDKHMFPMDPDQLCIDLTTVVTDKFPDIMKELDSVFVADVWVQGEGAYSCIVLCDSWISDNRKPTAEQIETLRQFFGVGEEGITTLANNEPMWWMDLMATQWHYARDVDDLKIIRRWDVRRAKAGVKG